MTTATFLVLVLRLLAPITILRWPVAGMAAALLADVLDVVLADLLALLLGEPPGFRPEYTQTDKGLDLYYQTIAVFVSLRWQNVLARRTSVALFLVRLIGTLLFAATGVRTLLFLFPNLFAWYFLYQAAAERYFPQYATRNTKQLGLILLGLLAPKLAQEYVLHIAELKPWQWFKGNFGAL